MTRKEYIDDLQQARDIQKTGLLWYEDGSGNDMKGVTWEPRYICPRVWRFFVWIEE